MLVEAVWIWGGGAVLLGMLVALAWVDAKTLRLPDRLTFPLIAVGLGVAAALGQLEPALIGTAVGYLTFLFVEIAYRRLRGRDGLGRGDAKLLAAGGAWCGWTGLPFIVMVASGAALLGVLLFSRGSDARVARIPFGPFLAFGIAMVWLAQRLAGV